MIKATRAGIRTEVSNARLFISTQLVERLVRIVAASASVRTA
ncbi:hypothetical protein [Enterovirga sp. CN4-39]